MSGFSGLTPTLRIVVRNPLLGKEYPSTGEVVAVIDTGYEGFLAVPKSVFDALSYGSLHLEERKLILGNGTELISRGTYGAFNVPDIRLRAAGFVETYEGVDEVLIGVEALSQTTTLLDYCRGKVKVEACA